RNFVVDPRVKGTVNIVSARPVARSLVYPTLLSALRMQGYAAVEADGVVKIVPEADAKTQAGPVQRGIVTDYADNLKRIDRIVASIDQPPAGEPMLVPVKNASALDVVALVNRLLTEGQPPGAPQDAQQRVSLVADPRSNSILVRSDNPGRGARVR